MPYLLSNFVLGPVLFKAGKLLATTWAPTPDSPQPTVDHDHPTVMRVKRLVLAANVCILAIEYQKNGIHGDPRNASDGCIALVVGWGMVSLACMIGDCVAFMCTEFYGNYLIFVYFHLDFVIQRAQPCLQTTRRLKSTGAPGERTVCR